MRNILIISRREITRLRSRFTGKSRILVMAILVIAGILSYATYDQGIGLNRGLYDIGVSPSGPVIDDDRFNVTVIDYPAGRDSLSHGSVDVYIGNNVMLLRNDDKSRYAAGALKRYLERQELLRISEDYDIDQAFPLRIKVHHLKTEQEELQIGAPESLVDILESQDAFNEPDVSSEPETPAVEEPESLSPQAEPLPDSHNPLFDPDPSPGDPVDPDITDSPPQDFDSPSDEAVRKQLEATSNNSGLPVFEAEFVSDEEIIIPSLLKPPIPIVQVALAFLYVLPMFFVGIFFTSSFVEEKLNRKVIVLLSAPVTPFDIIMGKMLPYIGYSIIAIITITLVLRANVLLALAIFIPVMLFILSIYIMVALLCRTSKDQTFFSVTALWIVIAYLVAPAMFAGVSNLSYISPLTLAVQMYRGESFGLAEYLLSTAPMYMIFLLTMVVGVRVFNEEYLTGFKPMHTKVGEAIYLAMDKSHLSVSVFCVSLFLIPVVFMVQFASIVMASNLPMPFSLAVILGLSVLVEEIAKSTGILVLLQNKVIGPLKGVIKLSLISALGFFIGEKLLVYLALQVLSESTYTNALFGSPLLLLPLILHSVATSIVCLSTARFGTRYYPLAILAGVGIHIAYNLWVISGELW